MGTSLANVIFLGAGAILSLGAVALATREIRFRRRAARAIGVIRERHVESGPDPEGGSRTTVTVTVEFVDGTGIKKQATTPVVTGTSLTWRRRCGTEFKLFGPPEYAVGDSVPILYDPERSEEIRVDTWMNRWLWVLVIGIMGTSFLCAGLML
jgi:hypothetical protein